MELMAAISLFPLLSSTLNDFIRPDLM